MSALVSFTVGFVTRLSWITRLRLVYRDPPPVHIGVVTEYQRSNTYSKDTMQRLSYETNKRFVTIM